MNPHDIEAIEPAPDLLWVRCACGRRFPGTSLAKAKERQQRHFEIEKMRTALRGEETDT